MNKKYQQPELTVVEIQNCNMICQSPVEGNAGLSGGGSDAGYGGVTRSRQSVRDDWDDWEE